MDDSTELDGLPAYPDLGDGDRRVATLFDGPVSDTFLHVEFSGAFEDVEISVTDGSVVSQNIYAQAADITFTEGEKYVVITGTALRESYVVRSLYVQDAGDADVEQNPLITSDEMADALAAHIANYLTLRNTYETEYRGDPTLQALDIFGAQTYYTDNMEMMVLTHELSFNGAWHGKLTLKGLS